MIVNKTLKLKSRLKQRCDSCKKVAEILCYRMERFSELDYQSIYWNKDKKIWQICVFCLDSFNEIADN